MKIRFGVGLGGGPETSPEALPAVVDRLEAAGVDSLWFSELVYTDAVDPFIGMAYAVARTSRLKVGTSVVVLPGRHPVLVAKQLASLAALAPKRVLPVFGLRSALAAERQVFVVPEGRRAAIFDESVRLLKTALSTDGGDFTGEFFQASSIAVRPRLAAPLDVWLGGSAPEGFRRIGRLADGWLGSFLTPDEARSGRTQIEVAAAEAGRTVEPDHYGINVGVQRHRPARRRPRGHPQAWPDRDPTELIADGWPALHRMTGPFEAWLLHRSLPTLELRLARQSDTALALARFLHDHPDVTRVRHPFLEDHPGHAIARRQMRHGGALVSFSVGDAERAQRFLGALELVAEATSFGGVHATAERRGRWGTDAVDDGFIRFSAGLEDAEDLIADVAQALARNS